MDNIRNKGRAAGITVLGIPMPQKLKDQIKLAAEKRRRTMADWARLELEKAANAVISSQELKVAEDASGNGSFPSTNANTARTNYPVGSRRRGKKNGTES